VLVGSGGGSVGSGVRVGGRGVEVGISVGSDVRVGEAVVEVGARVGSIEVETGD
jgi:hypothetical protein